MGSDQKDIMQRLKELYRAWSGLEPSEPVLLPLSGSARKYYRLDGPAGPVVGCIGVNPAENRAFLEIDRRMCEEGIAAPRVYGVSDDSMAYIQEDLGDSQLYELLKPSLGSGEFSEEQMGWLRKTISALPALQYGTGRRMDWNVCFPDREFNSRMVSFDLNYFKYDFLKLLRFPFDEIRLQDDCDALISDSLEPFGETFLYRDFQARNVMIKDGQPRFIDFQGGRRGPGQYDLASFLWNAGTHFSSAVRAELEMVYLDALKEFEPDLDEARWRRQYRILTLVRMLQESAAFGYLGIIQRKEMFLGYIPSLLKCMGELALEPFERYPYITEILCRLSEEWNGETVVPGLTVAL